ncbi:MAG: hypothetical protein ACK5SM_04190, partial [Sphingomonadales bacterium]
MGDNEGCADLLWRRAITAMAIKAVSSARPPTIHGHHASVSAVEGAVWANCRGGAVAGGGDGAALSCGQVAPTSADGGPRAVGVA